MLGLLAGTLGTIIGIGGGVVFVPVFLLLFHFTPQQAIGTSLVAVFFNALSGSFSYFRQRRVDIRAGWKFAVATLPGALLGAWMARFFTPSTLEIVFGILLIAVAIFIFLRRGPRQKEPAGRYTRTLVDFRGQVFNYSPKEGLGIAISFLVGIISSLLGIGGGIIHAPALIFALGFPVYVATATSLFVLSISTFFGGISHLVLGNVLIIPAIIVAAFAIPGAQIGALLSRRVRSRLITHLLAIALALVGLRLLLKSLGMY
ncbi:MAG: sulfite exporter TauE/SafE family protein [Chloroflexota bacterium]|nr:sulfite exporter TauE/SafE family protein [Chloroflexota bacterium]